MKWIEKSQSKKVVLFTKAKFGVISQEEILGKVFAVYMHYAV